MRHVYLERATHDLGEQMSRGGGQMSFPKPPSSMSLHSVLLASPFPLMLYRELETNKNLASGPGHEGPGALLGKRISQNSGM